SVLGGISNQLIPKASTPSSRRTNRTAPPGPEPSIAATSTIEYPIARPYRLHAEDAEAGLRDRRVERGGDAEGEHASGVERVDDPVVPQPRGRVVGVALLLVLRTDLVRVGVADHREHGRSLLAAHHGDPRVRPHPELARGVGATAHPVVAGAER